MNQNQPNRPRVKVMTEYDQLHATNGWDRLFSESTHTECFNVDKVEEWFNSIDPQLN